VCLPLSTILYTHTTYHRPSQDSRNVCHAAEWSASVWSPRLHPSPGHAKYNRSEAPKTHHDPWRWKVMASVGTWKIEVQKKYILSCSLLKHAKLAIKSECKKVNVNSANSPFAYTLLPLKILWEARTGVKNLLDISVSQKKDEPKELDGFRSIQILGFRS
jgi:hypothetical protein